MSTYKDLIVWQKSLDLVELVYEKTGSFPVEEKYSLTDQIRRATVFIPSNIAEGHGRKSDNEFVRFLRIAYGSSSELGTQLLIAKRLSLMSENDFKKLDSNLTEVRMMLNKLISTLLKAKD